MPLCAEKASSLNDILEVQHGRHLASLIYKEADIMALETQLAQYAAEHGNSIAQLIEIEAQKYKLESLNKKLAELNHIAHKAGMADVAADTIHTVGNILNSASISASAVLNILEKSSINKLQKANELLEENISDLEDYIKNNPNSRKHMMYYLVIEEVLSDENNSLKKEIVRVIKQIKTISNVISAQQSYIGEDTSMIEEVDLATIINDVLIMNSDSISCANIIIEKKLDKVPPIPVHKAKLMQILFYLLLNAKDAMNLVEPEHRKLVISLTKDADHVYIRLTDSGCGIIPENLTKIFNQGFTTKKSGHGLSLHYCANYMAEMKGKIWVESEGEGKGATFVLQIPDLLETSS